MKREGWLSGILEQQPGGVTMPGVPLAELVEDRRLLIEHHAGVTEYSRERIQIRVRYGYMVVCGEALNMCRMTKGQLVITGSIRCLQLIRG